MQLLFVSPASAFTYFEATRGYLERCGKSLAFHSGKASVFRINNNQFTCCDGQAQFGRAMNELSILASVPTPEFRWPHYVDASRS